MGLGWRERAIQKHVNFEPDPLPAETPQDLTDRHARNLTEWNLSRASALKRGDTGALKILDEEYKNGLGIDFPLDKTNLSFDTSIDFQPDVGFEADKQASQADVRKSEPTRTLADQNTEERDYNAALNAWLKTPTGQYHAGPDAREQFTKATGRPDPLAFRPQTEMAHLAAGGNVMDVTGESPAYNVAKPIAAIAGFSRGGPAGATASEGIVRATALAYNLNRAVQAGSIDPDEAYGILLKETTKGMGEDALFNFGVPLLGQIAMKIPGAQWLKERAAAGIVAGAKKLGLPSSAPVVPAPSERDVKLAERAALTEDPAKKAAIAALGERLPADKVMTPGQVTDMPGLWESNVRKGQPRQFDVLDKQMETAADKLLRETTTPVTGQPSAQGLGQQIQDLADITQAAVKKRLRPTFDEADNLGVRVDFSEVEKRARAALAEAERVPGTAPQQVKETEALRKLVDWFDTRAARDGTAPLHELKAELEQLTASRASALQDWGRFKTTEAQQTAKADNFVPVPGMPRVSGRLTEYPERAAEGAAAAKDAKTIAAQRKREAEALAPRIAVLEKEIGELEGRPMLSAEHALDFISDQKALLRATADWKPSTRLEHLVGDLTGKAEAAFSSAAVKSGNGDLVRRLGQARTDYKEVMGTVYDDAIKAALKKNPEDVGRFLWTGGNVSEPQQLQKMMGIANREGKLSTAQAIDLSRAVTRGFMQEAVPNIEAAAKWSQTLKENPAKRRTWEELTSAPGGAQLRNTMEVIEKAAQMALNTNIVMAGGTGLSQRAASGSVGVTSSKLHPGMIAGGLSYLAGMKMAATAYTHGDKGALNALARALRTQTAGTALNSKAAQEANAQVQAYLQAHNISNDEQAE